jgi:hypothetical protein
MRKQALNKSYNQFRRASKKMLEPKLCPNCPLLSLLPIIMSNRITYTREKEQLTPHKICQLLRALWLKHPYVTLEAAHTFQETRG